MTRLHDVGRERARRATSGSHEVVPLGGRRDAATLPGQSRSKDVDDEHKIGFGAHRTRLGRRLAHISGNPHQFGMRVAHLILTEPTTAKFVQHRTPGESVVDDAPNRPSVLVTEPEPCKPSAHAHCRHVAHHSDSKWSGRFTTACDELLRVTVSPTTRRDDA